MSIGGYLSQVASATPDPGSILSGQIGSGQIGNFHVASGQIQGLIGGGIPNVGSGTLNGFELGSGAIVSGRIASGQIGRFHVGSGQLAGFELGSGAIVSGRIASGQVGFGHLADASVQSGSLASGNVAKQHTASGLLQGAIQFVIDGGGAALAAGEKGDVIVPYDCRINYVNVFSDQSGGSVFLGIWRDSFANYPPTSGDTVAPSGVPLISGAIRNSYSGAAALSGWTTALTKGDVIKFVVHSGLTMTRVTIALQVGVGD